MNRTLATIGIAAGALTLFAFKKKDDYTKVIENMTWDVHDIRKLRTKNGKIYCDIDISFHNNTQYNFELETAGLIKLKQIAVFHNGKLFGNAFSQASSLSLPAYSSFRMTDIQIEIEMLGLIADILANGLDTNVENYTTRITVDALGQTFVIDPKTTV